MSQDWQMKLATTLLLIPGDAEKQSVKDTAKKSYN